MTTEWAFETQQIHAGQVPDPATGARALPIYQTTSFVFEDTTQAAARFALAELGPIYTRIGNPTQDAVEQRVAALEGGVAALLVASGSAANALAIQNLAEAGDHIVSSPSLYGGTYNLFHYTLPKYGIEVSFVENPDDPESWRAAAKPNTKAFFGESISNPKQDLLDIEAVAAVAHEIGVPLIVDNTVASPYLVQPLKWGADIVTHSATKYLGGHGTAIGGVIVDGGSFDYAQNPDKFPNYNTPDPSYNGLTYAKDLGVGSALGANLAFILKARVQLLRDLGPAVSPFNAFLIAQGIETLSLRVERHVENAVKVADFLEGRDDVVSVAYSGLESSPWHQLQLKYAPKGGGSVLAFEIAGGADAGRAFVDALELHSLVANIGDVRSLAIHPATTTHSQLTEAEQAHRGRHARPGAPVGGDREHRRYPGRPGQGLCRCRRRARRRRAARERIRGDGQSSWTTTPPNGWTLPRRQYRRRGRGAPATTPANGSFLSIGDLPLEADPLGVLPDVTLAYETWGELNEARDNAIYVSHALSGDSHAYGHAGPGHLTGGLVELAHRPRPSAGPHPPLHRLRQHRRRLSGHHRPRSPSPHGRPSVGFALSVADAARHGGGRGATHRRAGHRHVAAHAGPVDGRHAHPGMGGAIPGRACGRSPPWAPPRPPRRSRSPGPPHRRAAIRADARFAGGDYYDAADGEGPHAGLGIARMIAHTTYRSEPELHARFGRKVQANDVGQTDDARVEGDAVVEGDILRGPGQPGSGQYAIESYLGHHAEKLARRFDANTYLRIVHAINTHDVGRGRGGIEAALSRFTGPALVAAVDSDRLYPLSHSQELADALPGL